jgi:hypothetical protein
VVQQCGGGATRDGLAEQTTARNNLRDCRPYGLFHPVGMQGYWLMGVAHDLL